MIRELHHIPLADLKPSKLNVRRHGPKEIDSLAASIAGLGLIHPLLVRAKDPGFEVVAGQRRFLAMTKLNAEGALDTDAVPCVVMESTDDAAAIEASLAENVARLPMDDMDQFEAFATLRKKGLDEAEIAAHFAISAQVVKRRLAIGNLHPDIRRLYRAGDVDARTLHLLTLATRDRQKAWLALASDPEQTVPPPWQLKAWLLCRVRHNSHYADRVIMPSRRYRCARARRLLGGAVSIISSSHNLRRMYAQSAIVRLRAARSGRAAFAR